MRLFEHINSNQFKLIKETFVPATISLRVHGRTNVLPVWVYREWFDYIRRAFHFDTISYEDAKIYTVGQILQKLGPFVSRMGRNQLEIKKKLDLLNRAGQKDDKDEDKKKAMSDAWEKIYLAMDDYAQETNGVGGNPDDNRIHNKDTSDLYYTTLRQLLNYPSNKYLFGKTIVDVYGLAVKAKNNGSPYIEVVHS